MEIQKPIKKIIICLILLSVLAVIGLYIHLYQKSINITQGTPMKSSAYNEATADNTIVKESPIIESTRQFPALSDKSKASANNKINDLTDEYNDSQKNGVTLLYKRLSNQRAQNRESDFARYMRDDFFEEYYELFEELNLTLEELNELLDIFIVRGYAILSIHNKWEGIPSEEEYKQAYKDITEEYDLKIKKILDTDDFTIYRQFDERQFERFQITDFISGTEVRLDESQKQDLIEAMNEEVKIIGLDWINFDYFNQVSSFNNVELNEQAINYLDRMHEAYINASKNILSASQVDLLDTYLKKERDSIVKMIYRK